MTSSIVLNKKYKLFVFQQLIQLTVYEQSTVDLRADRTCTLLEVNLRIYKCACTSVRECFYANEQILIGQTQL